MIMCRLCPIFLGGKTREGGREGSKSQENMRKEGGRRMTEMCVTQRHR